jgi:hypothetical protein
MPVLSPPPPPPPFSRKLFKVKQIDRKVKVPQDFFNF